MAGVKRRKVDVECREFKEKWTAKYFFIESRNRPLCLICSESVSVKKEYNLKQHYETKHSAYQRMTGQVRKDKIAHLRNNLEKQQAVFTKASTESEDGEFVKECLTAAADILCPEKKNLFSNVSLSARTVTRRVEALATDVKHSLQDICKSTEYFSLALDESTDTTDTAQLAIFVRGVSPDFKITEDLARMVAMKDTTTGEDIFQATKTCIEDMGLEMEKLVSVTTDEAPAMVGARKGAVSLLENEMKDRGLNRELVKLHCIIHQEALCAKSATLNNVMNVVVKTVNFIRSKGLNHRQFQELLRETEGAYGDLLYHCEVRWLSRGDVLERVYHLRNEIAEFMELKGMESPEFSDAEWITQLAFLVDITKHLCRLNVQLQGRKQLMNVIYSHIVAFETKLGLWESHLQQGNFAHFPNLVEQNPQDTTAFVEVVAELKKQFSKRFSDMRSKCESFKLFATPFDIHVDASPAEIQMELIELQSNDSLRSKNNADGVSLLDFYRRYLMENNTFPHIVAHAKRVACMFGSTYVCEQFFLKLKYIKSRLRSRITDSHLEGVLRLATSSINPKIGDLARDMQNQSSH
ncbi:General transcription factor II-I repeat domain-containing protein 2B [Holothuria leucospilota]|uniref:General transcription factor II-I repeat domain-containing protein 2B n=1 Tax=Holothuria leucospilota TaxID=206669 RepID=A0A9Q1BS64_HOLLE|nr:General transcription factor II-I repeat domain-containing protein 2B [Holothuria leucospilota]